MASGTSSICSETDSNPMVNAAESQSEWPLPQEDYQRYGRQMIVPEVGLEGQLKLKAASILVVGVGGLGCPAAAYLAAAGIGTIGLIDGDIVEVSNLQRQILHSTETLGMGKVDSALLSLRRLNPTIQYVPYRTRLSSAIAPSVFSTFDIILDCTDQPASRYLISDTAVLLGKQLVSASALRAEGQLMVLNDPPLAPGQPSGGPCYRCVFPKPPSAETVISCEEGGILGPVVGIMGVYQALEAIRLVIAKTNIAQTSSGNADPNALMTSQGPTMLLFSAFSMPPFRSVRLRGRRKHCATCSAQASVTLEVLQAGSLDYLEFCGVNRPPNVLSQDERISVKDYDKIRRGGTEHILIDVREKVQFNICNIKGSINMPFSAIQSASAATAKGAGADSSSAYTAGDILPENALGLPVYVLCRLGNDSQLVVKWMKEQSHLRKHQPEIRDIQGGLKAWKEEVDQNWPFL